MKTAQTEEERERRPEALAWGRGRRTHTEGRRGSVRRARGSRKRRKGGEETLDC
ncbi:hypothetical protein Sjap_007309 [Stephania japonica]|uniref:Uncharacterized protein n=1 Tax=Stephania japonica TaxID=461633 RepID=A0AAP0JN94_9MAGN